MPNYGVRECVNNADDGSGSVATSEDDCHSDVDEFSVRGTSTDDHCTSMTDRRGREYQADRSIRCMVRAITNAYLSESVINTQGMERTMRLLIILEQFGNPVVDQRTKSNVRIL